MADAPKITEVDDKPDKPAEKPPEAEKPKEEPKPKKKKDPAKLLFLGAAVLVVIIALIQSRKGAAEDAAAAREEQHAYYLDGYPAEATAAGFSGSMPGGSYTSVELERMNSMIESQNAFMENYDARISELTDTMKDVSEQNGIFQKRMAYDSDVAQMAKNAHDWHTADSVTREQLHKENTEIAGKHGFLYDGPSGTWRNPDTGRDIFTGVPFNPQTSQAPPPRTAPAPTGPYRSSSQRERDAAVNQMKVNSDAWHKAGPEERQRLHAQNTELAKKHNLTYDGKTGTYTDSSGKRAY